MRNDIFSLGKIINVLKPCAFYGIVAKKCLKPIDKRYGNVGEVREALEKCEKLPKQIGTIILILAVIFVLAGLVVRIKSVDTVGENKKDNDTVKELIQIRQIEKISEEFQTPTNEEIQKTKDSINAVKAIYAKSEEILNSLFEKGKTQGEKEIETLC